MEKFEIELRSLLSKQMGHRCSVVKFRFLLIIKLDLATAELHIHPARLEMNLYLNLILNSMVEYPLFENVQTLKNV